MPDAPFTLGINYWPRRKAMYWWKQFDRAEVVEEFAQIADLGLQSVRFFLLWEDFQPEPNRVDLGQIDHLLTVLDVAQHHHLSATPTLLVGNMSNVQWWPPWAYTDQPEGSRAVQISGGQEVRRRVRSVFSDGFMLEAETRLARAVREATAGHPALSSWDLANEIDQIRPPSSPEAGATWARQLSEALAPIPLTCGAHSMSLTTNGLTISALAPFLNYLSMHGYPMYSPVAQGPLDSAFVPFVTALTTALGGKPCLMQEFGVSTSGPGEPSRVIDDWMLGQRTEVLLVNEEEAARYLHDVLDRLWVEGAPGASLWIYSDYSPDLWSRPPLDRAHRERYFGLFRSDGSPKPGAEMVARWTRDLQSGALERRLGPHGSGRITLHVDPHSYYRDPHRSFRKEYARYRRAVPSLSLSWDTEERSKT